MNRNTIPAKLCLVATLLFAAVSSARGDAIWQALFFEAPILSKTWWVIPVGLAIEFPVVQIITGFSWRKAAWITVQMNAISFVVGLILQMPSLRLGGTSWYFFVYLAAVVGNTLIEAAVIREFSTQAFLLRSIALLAAVNALSVGLTLTVLFHYA